MIIDGYLEKGVVLSMEDGIKPSEILAFEKGYDKSKLVKKTITDSRGHRTTRWVRAGTDQPKEKKAKEESAGVDVEVKLYSHADGMEKLLKELPKSASKGDIKQLKTERSDVINKIKSLPNSKMSVREKSNIQSHLENKWELLDAQIADIEDPSGRFLEKQIAKFNYYILSRDWSKVYDDKSLSKEEKEKFRREGNKSIRKWDKIPDNQVPFDSDRFESRDWDLSLRGDKVQNRWHDMKGYRKK